MVIESHCIVSGKYKLKSIQFFPTLVIQSAHPIPSPSPKTRTVLNTEYIYTGSDSEEESGNYLDINNIHELRKVLIIIMYHMVYGCWSLIHCRLLKPRSSTYLSWRERLRGTIVYLITNEKHQPPRNVTPNLSLQSQDWVANMHLQLTCSSIILNTNHPLQSIILIIVLEAILKKAIFKSSSTGLLINGRSPSRRIEPYSLNSYVLSNLTNVVETDNDFLWVSEWSQ